MFQRQLFPCPPCQSGGCMEVDVGVPTHGGHPGTEELRLVLKTMLWSTAHLLGLVYISQHSLTDCSSYVITDSLACWFLR